MGSNRSERDHTESTRVEPNRIEEQDLHAHRQPPHASPGSPATLPAGKPEWGHRSVSNTLGVHVGRTKRPSYETGISRPPGPQNTSDAA